MSTSTMMKKLSLATAGAALMAIGTGTASYAATFVDQNQSDASTYIAAFSQTNLAQSFQQASNNIAGASIFLQPRVGSIGDITISLWDALPNAGGKKLTSGTALGQQSGSWADIFWKPVSVTPNTNLFLVFESTSPALGIAGSVSNPYSRGQTYANPGYQSFSQFDYAFRTFADDSFKAASVPEPASTLGLLAFGVLSAASALKRKNGQNTQPNNLN